MGQAALIVAGPTASGKSALAMVLAERLRGTVINADSMQVYRELRVLTARPTAADEARVPHALYGVRAAAAPGSAAWWRGAALAAMDQAAGEGRLPILCGGTGLYLQALTRGITGIPEPGAAVRSEARALLAEQGAAALHARLAAVDPQTAATLQPSDGQRIARAWEVWRGTGRGLRAWQAATLPPPPPWRFRMMLVDPPRAALREAVAARFAAMLAEGAIEEVRNLLALDLDPALPIMRAQGVPELGAYVRGEMTLETATARAVLATGQYVKRQATWFRNRSIADPSQTHRIDARFVDLAQFSERKWTQINDFISGTG